MILIRCGHHDCDRSFREFPEALRVEGDDDSFAAKTVVLNKWEKNSVRKFLPKTEAFSRQVVCCQYMAKTRGGCL